MARTNVEAGLWEPRDWVPDSIEAFLEQVTNRPWSHAEVDRVFTDWLFLPQGHLRWCATWDIAKQLTRFAVSRSRGLVAPDEARELVADTLMGAVDLLKRRRRLKSRFDPRRFPVELRHGDWGRRAFRNWLWQIHHSTVTHKHGRVRRHMRLMQLAEEGARRIVAAQRRRDWIALSSAPAAGAEPHITGAVKRGSTDRPPDRAAVSIEGLEGFLGPREVSKERCVWDWRHSGLSHEESAVRAGSHPLWDGQGCNVIAARVCFHRGRKRLVATASALLTLDPADDNAIRSLVGEERLMDDLVRRGHETEIVVRGRVRRAVLTLNSVRIGKERRPLLHDAVRIALERVLNAGVPSAPQIGIVGGSLCRAPSTSI